MKLKKNAIKNIAEYGYTILPDVLNKKEIKEIKNEIKLVLLECCSNVSKKKSNLNSNDIDKLYLLLKEKSPTLKGHCYDVLSRLALIYNAVAKEKIKKVAKEFLNGPLIINSTQLRIDDSSDDRILPWHQELEQMALVTLNIWIPLVKIKNSTGGIAIIPNSHKLGIKRHFLNKGKSNYFSLPKKQINDNNIKSLALDAGDALLFHSLLFHKSIQNTGKKIRWTIVSRYNQLSSMPYVKSAKAPIFMKRNPSHKSPGHDFLRIHRKK